VGAVATTCIVSVQHIPRERVGAAYVIGHRTGASGCRCGRASGSDKWSDGRAGRGVLGTGGGWGGDGGVASGVFGVDRDAWAGPVVARSGLTADCDAVVLPGTLPHAVARPGLPSCKFITFQVGFILSHTIRMADRQKRPSCVNHTLSATELDAA
jgi:hypothetical protein